jgi:hypothetical protein
MRNLRMTMPQYVTNVTSFGDAVRILKNKSIIVETMEGKSEEDEIDAMVKKMEDEKTGEEAVKSQYDLGEAKPEDKEFDEEEEEEETYDFEYDEDEMFNPAYMNEAKKKEDKVEYSKQQVNPTELRLGIRTELECDSDMELDKAKEIAYKNIAKDPIYYTKLKLSGVEAHPKKVKGEKEVPAKKKKEAIQLVDLVNGMQKVKMPKKDDKKKLKEGIDEAMSFADLPADPEKYKIVKDSKGYIIKATNADGVEFQKGDVAKTYDGEEIKIAKFEESQGKVKAIYSTGMFFRGIDIDGLEAPKPTMRPGVDMGASFEKMKKSMQEIVRETISEYFDGRDNLDAKNELSENEEPLQQFATKIAAQHNLMLVQQPLGKAQLFSMYQKEKGSFGNKSGVITYEPSSKVVNVLSSDEKIPQAVYAQFKADRGGNDAGFETKTFAEKDAQIAYFKNFQIAG